jgi:hypothetical protein
MNPIFRFWESKAEGVRALFFDKPEGGAAYRLSTEPRQHVTLPNGSTIMVPLNITVAPVLDKQ